MKNYLRFLWWEGGRLETEPKEYRIAFHLCGADSSPGGAHFGLKYLSEQYKADFPAASTFTENHFYFDGLISLQQNWLLRHKTRVLTSLHGATPSDKAEIHDIPTLSSDLLHESHVFRMQWLIEHDAFRFKTDTKFQIHSWNFSSLYDPLGFIAPFILKG